MVDGLWVYNDSKFEVRDQPLVFGMDLILEKMVKQVEGGGSFESCFFIHSFSGFGVFTRICPGGDGGVRVSLGGEETAGLAQSVTPELFPRTPAGNLSATAPGWLIFLLTTNGMKNTNFYGI